MNKQDEEFFRHLYRQIEEHKKEQHLTTLRVIEQRNKNNKRKHNPKSKPAK